jgi:DNA-binding NarL/FixJ family response regulator
VFLVVEDEPDMQTMIRLLLTRDPRLASVGSASSAETALELLDRVEPSLIILDHSIEGGVLGLEAAPMLKRKAPHAKILLFTAFDMRKEATEEPAVDAYLRKDRFEQLLPTALQLLALEPAAS